jgi:hypothetical protein
MLQLFFLDFGWACKFRQVAPIQNVGYFSLLRDGILFFWEIFWFDCLIWYFDNFFMTLGWACKNRRIDLNRIFGFLFTFSVLNILGGLQESPCKTYKLGAFLKNLSWIGLNLQIIPSETFNSYNKPPFYVNFISFCSKSDQVFRLLIWFKSLTT